MKGQIVSLLAQHSVYASTQEVLYKTADKLGLEKFDFPQNSKKIIYRSKTRHFGYVSLEFKKENLYLADSPFVSFETWKLMLRNIPCVIVEEYNPRKGFKDFFAKNALRFFSSRPFIVLTKRTYLFLKSLGATPLLVPPAAKKRRATKKREHILFVGRAIASKNPFLFIRLAELLKDEKFVFIGKGELADEITKKTKSLDNFEYIPFAESMDVLFDYYSRSKILIHPAFRDPIGFVIVEALSTSTPVISSYGAGASDYLPKDWVVDSVDEAEWIRKIKGVLENLEGNVRLAKETFENEHLDIDDPYFDKMNAQLEEKLKIRWPALFQ